MRPSQEQIIAGLDVGSHKVVAIVGSIRGDGSVEVIGVGSSPSTGLRKGVVVSVNETVEAIKRAIHEAELMAGCTVKAVHCSVSGAHLRCFNNKGVVNVQGDRVTEADVERVLDNAKAVAVPPDRTILHTIPQEFLAHDNDGIMQPVGIHGTRVTANVHIVTAIAASQQNIIQCCQHAGLIVVRPTAELLASATAVLEDDDKDLGVMLADIGSGTTDIAIYHRGSLVYSAVLPIGGDLVSSDVAVGLRVSRQEAERIKLKHGCALANLAGDDESFECKLVGGRDTVIYDRRLLAEVIEPRMEEIFHFLRREMEASNFMDLLGSGLVLTGGGALLEGVEQLGTRVLGGMPVRVGVPRQVAGLYDMVKSPAYACALGLVLHAAEHDNDHHRKSTAQQGNWWTRLVGGLREFF
jgi:cell division protein FtsA